MIDVMLQRNFPTCELSNQRKPLGVVGGMGTLATAKFLEALARKSRFETDQDHIPYICLSAPNIPDRSQAISIGSDAPLRQIVERASWLEKAGCGAIAIPCNTAHLWAREIKQALSVKLIDMVEITKQAIDVSHGSEAHNLRSITLGTNATMQHGLYVERNENHFGKGCCRRLKTLQNEIARIIADVKSGNTKDAKDKLTRVVKIARCLEPDVIILACSELSAICGDIADGHNIVDPIDILADACIAWWIAESQPHLLANRL